MPTEKGIVIETNDGTAWVKTEKSSACESCSSRGSCLALGGGNDMKVKAINTIGAASGDRVVLSFRSSSLLKATFFLYMFPVLCLIGGATAGLLLAPRWNVNDQTLSAVTGFFCFFVSIIIIRVRGNKMSLKDEYKPKIIRIVKR